MSGQTLEEVRTIERMAKVQKEDCMTIEDAVKEVGVTRQTLYVYMNVLGIQRYGFPRDRKTYLLKEDVEQIKQQVKASGG